MKTRRQLIALKRRRYRGRERVVKRLRYEPMLWQLSSFEACTIAEGILKSMRKGFARSEAERYFNCKMGFSPHGSEKYLINYGDCDSCFKRTDLNPYVFPALPHNVCIRNGLMTDKRTGRTSLYLCDNCFPAVKSLWQIKEATEIIKDLQGAINGHRRNTPKNVISMDELRRG